MTSVRVQLLCNHPFLLQTLRMPLHSHQIQLYVDITAKAQGYMDVLAFYSFLRKNLISRCQRKAISHFPRRPVYMHIDMLQVDHRKLSTTP